MNQSEKTPEVRQVELLEELVRWTKVANYDKLYNILRTELKTDRQRFIYQATGDKTQPQICKEYKISPKKVTALWKKWEQRGLLEREKSGKYKRLFDLKGFELLPKKKTQSEMPLNTEKEEENEQTEEGKTEDN